MNKSIWIYIGIAALVGLGVIGLFTRVTKPTEIVPQTKNTPTSPAQSSRTAPVKEAVVRLTDSGFEPQKITIQKGESVRWEKASKDARASVNSDDHPLHRKFPELNLGEFTDGYVLSHVFTIPGTYTYHDHFHPDRKGIVVVE